MRQTLTMILVITACGLLLAQDGPKPDLKLTEKQQDAMTCGEPGTIGSRDEAMKQQKALREFSPEVGEAAPDFHLADPDGDNEVHLQTACKEKPIVLIFGSYT